MIRREIGKMKLPDHNNLKRKKLIPVSSISYLKLLKMPLLNISKKLLEKKHSKNILIKGVILKDSKD